jgi:hypothetical protein
MVDIDIWSICIHTGVGKSSFTVVRIEKRHASYDKHNSFNNNNNNNNNNTIRRQITQINNK